MKTRRDYIGLLLFLALVLVGTSLINPGHKVHAALPAGANLAGVMSCGTSASCASIASVGGGEVVIGTATLTTGSVTITGLPFTSATSYVCSWSDQTTAANGLGKIVYVSASSITVTSNVSSSDAVSWMCFGN